MKFTELTDEQIKNLSTDELLEMDLKEMIDNINQKTNQITNVDKHLNSLGVLSCLLLLLEYGFFTLIFVIPFFALIITKFFLLRKKKTKHIILNMGIRLYEDMGVINQSNRFILEKYLNKIQ